MAHILRDWFNRIGKSKRYVEYDHPSLIHEAIAGVVPGYKEALLLARLSRPDGTAVHELRELFRTSQLRKLMSVNEPDVRYDIIDLYLVRDDNDNLHAIFLVDPFEYLLDPHVVDVINNVTVDELVLKDLRDSGRQL